MWIESVCKGESHLTGPKDCWKWPVLNLYTHLWSKQNPCGDGFSNENKATGSADTNPFELLHCGTDLVRKWGRSWRGGICDKSPEIPHVRYDPVPGDSKRDLLLAKDETMSNVGCESVREYLRKGNNNSNNNKKNTWCATPAGREKRECWEINNPADTKLSEEGEGRCWCRSSPAAHMGDRGGEGCPPEARGVPYQIRYLPCNTCTALGLNRWIWPEESYVLCRRKL